MFFRMFWQVPQTVLEILRVKQWKAFVTHRRTIDVIYEDLKKIYFYFLRDNRYQNNILNKYISFSLACVLWQRTEDIKTWYFSLVKCFRALV